MENFLKRNSLLSMVSAPAIWAVHFFLSYEIVSLACAGGYLGPWAVDLTAIRISIGAVTLAAVGLLAHIALINYQKWQRARRSGRVGGNMSEFFALCSMRLCGLSAIALIWVAFPAFVLSPCTA